jgi:hypothetical protein
MKKLSFYLMIMALSLCTFPTTILAAEKNTPKEIPAEVKSMLNRLDEIKEMDKSSLSTSEKKELRKEVKTIKKNLRSTGNGIYLSVSAIIIILLVLILLL